MNYLAVSVILAVALLAVIYFAHRIIRDQQDDYRALLKEKVEVQQRLETEREMYDLLEAKYRRQGVTLYRTRINLAEAVRQPNE